jgi:DMSO reductase anchor subunit
MAEFGDIVTVFFALVMMVGVGLFVLGTFWTSNGVITPNYSYVWFGVILLLIGLVVVAFIIMAGHGE